MKKVIFTVLAAKASIFLLIYLAAHFLPFSKATYLEDFHYPADAPLSIQTAYCTWDAQHYLFLAQNGYHAGQESNRFFPLLPALIRLFAPLFGYLVSGLVVANIFSMMGLIYLYYYVKEFTKSEEAAGTTLLVALAFPTSFFFSLIYSEGLFLGLVAPLFYFLFKRRFLAASIFAFFLPLTRPTGLLIGIPLAVGIAGDYWEAFKGPSKGLPQKRRVFRPSLLPLFAAILGAGLYFLIMFHTTGNCMTGLSSQNNTIGHWQISTLIHPQSIFGNFFPATYTLHGFTNSVIDRLFFLFFVLLLPRIWLKTTPVLFSYALAMGMVPVFGSFASYPRYLLLVLPLFIALGISFSQEKRKPFLFPFLYACLLLQSLFLIMHALNHWAA
ncbi:MAG TPA: hypothetical protein VGI03_11990 [Verrucomicrobiae bacterium]|jgi:hypothetical protein